MAITSELIKFFRKSFAEFPQNFCGRRTKLAAWVLGSDYFAWSIAPGIQEEFQIFGKPKESKCRRIWVLGVSRLGDSPDYAAIIDLFYYINKNVITILNFNSFS